MKNHEFFIYYWKRFSRIAAVRNKILDNMIYAFIYRKKLRRIDKLLDKHHARHFERLITATTSISNVTTNTVDAIP